MRTCGYTPFLAFLRRFYYLCYSPVDFRATLLSGFFGYSHWEVLPLRMWMNFDRRSWMRQRVTHWNSEISHHCGFYQRSTGWFFRRTWMGSWLLFVLESDSQWYTVHIYIIIYNHIYNIIIIMIISIISNDSNDNDNNNNHHNNQNNHNNNKKNNHNNNINNNNIYIYICVCDMEFGVIQQKKTCRVIMQHWQWGSISFMKWWAKHA